MFKNCLVWAVLIDFIQIVDNTVVAFQCMYRKIITSIYFEILSNEGIGGFNIELIAVSIYQIRYISYKNNTMYNNKKTSPDVLNFRFKIDSYFINDNAIIHVRYSLRDLFTDFKINF